MVNLLHHETEIVTVSKNLQMKFFFFSSGNQWTQFQETILLPHPQTVHFSLWSRCTSEGKQCKENTRSLCKCFLYSAAWYCTKCKKKKKKKRNPLLDESFTLKFATKQDLLKRFPGKKKSRDPLCRSDSCCVPKEAERQYLRSNLRSPAFTVLQYDLSVKTQPH